MLTYKDPEYHRQQSKLHYQKHKAKYNARNQLQKQRTREMVAEAKKGGCVVCNEMEISCLDFHHLEEDEKDRAISTMRGMNDERVMEEIKKCVVLCSNCHRKHHAGKLNVSF